MIRKSLQNYWLCSLLILCSLLSFAQENFTVSGYMRDASSGEELLYANVVVTGTTQGVTTNLYGFYSLSLPKGEHTLQYSYLGYDTQELEIVLDQDIRQDVELGVASQQLKEIVVKSEKENENITNTEVSVVKLDIKETKAIPVLLGEQDILKTIQLLPGVSPSSEGSSGFFVRGGNADQNLILLDEAPVYNASHLLGFFSVFNSDALKDVKLYKGGIPAQYGGRASSVMDVRMKNGNMKKLTGSGGIGLIASRLTLETPIVKDKASIMISGRRTYADLLLQALLPSDFGDFALYFYDLNLKANAKVGKKDRLYASAYLGRDVLGAQGLGFDWGNKTGTLRWNHIFNNKLFSNTSIIYSDYDYGFSIQDSGNELKLSAGIYDYNIKQDFTWYAHTNHQLQLGFQGIYHIFKPSIFTVKTIKEEDDTQEKKTESSDEQQALETAWYISNEQKVNDRLIINYGLRLSSISNIGPFKVKEYNEENEIVKETDYAKGQFYNTYIGLEPRINASFTLNDISSVKASYNRIYQYLHLLTNSNSGRPNDIWVPSSSLVKPQIADQIAFGYFRNLNNHTYQFSVETYYKNLLNQVDFEDGAQTFNNPDIEAELIFGIGRAYGLEFLLEKQKGSFKGWLSYTLAKSERKFEDIDNGNWFSARQDRTHDFSLVLSYELNPKLMIAGSFVYYTGNAVTFPTGKYYIDGELVNLYSRRNDSRMPDYHRLDLGITWKLKERKYYKSDINVSVYNLYNRRNAYSITFRESETNPNTTEAVRLSLFGIVPSVSWNFNF